MCLMGLRKLCGLPNKPLLDPKGYSGQDRCAVCHEKEHIQWSLTGHADAFKSVQRKGREDDPACVSCHVTGWGKTGGYAINPARDLGPRLFTLIAGWGVDVFRAGNGWWWIPIVGPLVGGVLGGCAYDLLITRWHADERPEGKSNA